MSNVPACAHRQTTLLFGDVIRVSCLQVIRSVCNHNGMGEIDNCDLIALKDELDLCMDVS